MSDEHRVLSLLNSVAEGECRDYEYLTVWEQRPTTGKVQRALRTGAAPRPSRQ